jgi:hypothetical protein
MYSGRDPEDLYYDETAWDDEQDIVAEKPQEPVAREQQDLGNEKPNTD